MTFKIYISFIIVAVLSLGCNEFEEFNTNPNEPIQVSVDVLFPNAIRESVNTAVNASFLVGNNAAQLTAKTLRLEVDAYTWNAFPIYWEGWYESLTDLKSIEKIAIDNGNEKMQGATIVLRSWIFQNLTNAYGDIPYFNATLGAEDNFTPVYDSQESIYADLLEQLEKANSLLDGSGSIDGDILLNGSSPKWKKFANSLRLRLLMTASHQMADAATRFASIYENEELLSSNEDNVQLVYTGSFPNEFPLIPLKIGDADAVAISKTSLDVMLSHSDPRLHRYTRPNDDDFSSTTDFIGAINGQGASCSKNGASRLGIQYYNYPTLINASSLGLPNANGHVMSYSEVEFLLAEAAAKGWISSDVEAHYKAGIGASMAQHFVDFATFGYDDFADYYDNSGVAYATETDIWQQKWLALFFHGLEPYFEVRRWFVSGGSSFGEIPFLNASCENLNNDQLPLRFLYPGEEQSLNADSYNQALQSIGGSNNQNAPMWITQ